VKGRELEHVLALADELHEVRSRLRRAEALAFEMRRDEEIERRAPELAAAAAASRPRIEQVARELERQWVAQGGLVAAWQRAVEFEQVAQSAGAEAASLHSDADSARRRVEAARLGTRDQQERLVRERDALADVLVDAPFDVPVPPPVRDDDRPEATRRDAIAMIELTHRAEAVAGEAAAEAAVRLRQARAELSRIGRPDELRRRCQELERGLPEAVVLDGSEPPSVPQRLRRAGIRMDV
jgi:hypothetical protein